MRVNLVTPFEEKDAVKALGARWDATKRCWYIVDVADLTPFARWTPNIDAAMGNLTDEVKQSAKSSSKVFIHKVVSAFRIDRCSRTLELATCRFI